MVMPEAVASIAARLHAAQAGLYMSDDCERAHGRPDAECSEAHRDDALVLLNIFPELAEGKEEGK